MAELRAWAKAEAHYAQAEKEFERLGDARNALYAKLGRIRGELPRRSVAEVSQQLEEILASPQALADDRIRLRCLVIKGEVDTDWDATLAEADWSQALELAKKLNDGLWINRASAELGIVKALLGKTSEGVMMVASALKKAEESKDLSSVVRWLSVLGTGYLQFGQNEGALKFFDRALAAGSGVEELRFPQMAYLGKITALRSLGRIKETNQLMATALQIARERESLGYLAELLQQDGLIAEAAGSRADAVAKLQEAADYAKRAAALRVLAEINLNLGRLQIAIGEKEQGATTLRAGVEAARAIKERLLTPKLLAQFAEVEIRQGNLKEASALLQEAAEIAEGQLAGVWSPWVKARLVGIMDSVFEARIRTHLLQGSTPEVLFGIVEQARGRVVTDLLMDRGQGQPRTSAGYVAGARRLSTLQSQFWKASSSASRQRLLDQIFRAEADMIDVSVQVDRSRQTNRSRTIAKLNEVQQSLRSDELMLEYILSEPSSVALAVTRERAWLVKLKGRNDIKKSVAEAWKAIQAGNEPGRESALHEVLNIAGLQSKPNLIVVPDAELNKIPFETLRTTTGAMLLESHAVSYAPSATAFYLVRSANSQVILPTK